MNSEKYWRKREEEALQHYITDEKEYDKEISRIYDNMLDRINSEISSFYGRYASKEGITIAEAKKRVSKLDIAAYERKAKKYVKEKNFSDKANEEMRLYNLTMKVNRLEMLKANIGLEMIAGHAELEEFMEEILKGRTMEELERQAGILGKTVRGNAQKAHTIVNASFKNATFSDRIWMYQDLMKSDLNKLLQQGMIQGKNPRVLARDIAFYVNGRAKERKGAKYYAERLMRTELARVQTEAQKQSFDANGFDEYKFLANSGCCDICHAINGKVFKVKDMMPGTNAAPMHPNCRCSVCAHSDRAEYEKWLEYLENGGTTAEWQALKAKEIKQTGGKRYKPVDEDNKRDVRAAKAYRKISRENDAEIIAANTGFDIKEIRQIKRHIFFDKHKKYDGYGLLDPDYDIAVAWLRLRSKMFEKRDITLLRHELLESELEKMYNLSISEAHARATKKYDWEKELIEAVGEGGEKDGLL